MVDSERAVLTTLSLRSMASSSSRSASSAGNAWISASWSASRSPAICRLPLFPYLHPRAHYGLAHHYPRSVCVACAKTAITVDCRCSLRSPSARCANHVRQCERGLERCYGAGVDPLAPFGPVTQTWFRQSFAEPTPVQARGWASIARGEHTRMLAPTGSGKTLAAFLWCLDRLARADRPGAGDDGTRVVYVSPIKALAYDVERNLRAPLAGLVRLGAGAEITVDVRTGDTSARERERQRKQPADILITTPESLYLVLAGRSRERLRAVDTIIVDEIHARAPTKRGIHLGLSLERLSHLVTGAGGAEPQRIGLSATQRPLAEVARYLGGDRPVEIIDASAPPAMDLAIVVPAQEMDHPGTAGRDGGGMWPLIYPQLLEMILAHRTTIIFVNSRRLAERLSQQLTELAGSTGAVRDGGGELVRAHHGSVARHQRLEIEEALKAGRLRAIVATSSLELRLDMGTVDLVIQVESPGAVSRGLQRIGRAGHHVGGVSIGRIVPKFRGDLLEATVVAQRMLAGGVGGAAVPAAGAAGRGRRTVAR